MVCCRLVRGLLFFFLNGCSSAASPLCTSIAVLPLSFPIRFSFRRSTCTVVGFSRPIVFISRGRSLNSRAHFSCSTRQLLRSWWVTRTWGRKENSGARKRDARRRMPGSCWPSSRTRWDGNCCSKRYGWSYRGRHKQWLDAILRWKLRTYWWGWQYTSSWNCCIVLGTSRMANVIRRSTGWWTPVRWLGWSRCRKTLTIARCGFFWLWLCKSNKDPLLANGRYCMFCKVCGFPLHQQDGSAGSWWNTLCQEYGTNKLQLNLKWN